MAGTLGIPGDHKELVRPSDQRKDVSEMSMLGPWATVRGSISRIPVYAQMNSL